MIVTKSVLCDVMTSPDSVAIHAVTGEVEVLPFPSPGAHPFLNDIAVPRHGKACGPNECAFRDAPAASTS